MSKGTRSQSETFLQFDLRRSMHQNAVTKSSLENLAANGGRCAKGGSGEDLSSVTVPVREVVELPYSLKLTEECTLDQDLIAEGWLPEKVGMDAQVAYGGFHQLRNERSNIAQGLIANKLHPWLGSSHLVSVIRVKVIILSHETSRQDVDEQKVCPKPAINLSKTELIGCICKDDKNGDIVR
ncbi:Diacylglycerol kinase 4-like protein [Drosera capensis]